MATTTSTASQSNDKMMAMLATLPGIGLIMFLVMKDASPLVKNYAKQSNAVLALYVIGVLAAIITFFLGGLLGWLIDVVALVAWIMLVVNAYGEKMYKLPVIGDFFDGLLK